MNNYENGNNKHDNMNLTDHILSYKELDYLEQNRRNMESFHHFYQPLSGWEYLLIIVISFILAQFGGGI